MTPIPADKEPRCTARRLSTGEPGLILNELTVADAPAYYSILDRNRDHLSRYGDYQDEANATIDWATDHLARPTHDRFGIWWNQMLIGRIDLVHAAPPQYALGYWLSQDALGHGYATTACAAIIRHACTTHSAADIYAGVTHGNRPSMALLRRLGFQPITRLDHYTRFHLPLTPTPSPIHEH